MVNFSFLADISVGLKVAAKILNLSFCMVAKIEKVGKKDVFSPFFVRLILFVAKKHYLRAAKSERYRFQLP